ncbi:hypothetical protein [Dactylosporangium sp. CA-139066]|uniref:hypothetical protein n=1 Tax=Dactylosporangium sp. CA-139066 TaxID=3239930 RepID=UPI003D90EB98
MSDALPPIEAPVLVAAVDALPARLRKKLDDSAAKFADRPVTRDGDRYAVAIDDATTVTLTVTGGVVRAPEAVTCTCLLAPNCLHRASVLSLAPIHDGSEPTTDGSEPTTDGNEPAPAAGNGEVAAGEEAKAPDTTCAELVPEDGAEVLTTQQAAAVAQLWRAAAGVLADGVTGSGAVARAALLRAAHEAQACKVYRAAAAARVVASLLQAARAGDAHYRLADLGEALRELLTVTHRLRGGAVAEGWLGSARRQYQLQGSLRLYGLCTTAVLAGTGHAGVVTYAADRGGRLWMIADLMPGDARRAARAGGATIAMGETALTHRGLTRAGLVVTGATAAGSRQLGAGRGVKAVTASGSAWHEEPLAGLWAEPVAQQVHRAFEALAVPITDRVAGGDLLFLRVSVLGTDGDAVLARAADGMALLMRVAVDHPALGYRENLRVLGRAEGLELLVIARPDPGRPGTVLPLAVAPVPDGPAWHLPAPGGGHVDLAFDRLHRSQLPRAAAEADEPVEAADATGGDEGKPEPDDTWRPAVHDPTLQRLTAHLERTVAGGRVMLTFPNGRGPSDASRMRAARLETGAGLLEALVAAAADRPRDAFGRLAADDGTAFAQAWLAAATYADAAARALAETSWLPTADP